MTDLDLAARFALALDQEDYPAATALLSDDCVYTVRGQRHEGPSAIIASYRGNGDKAARTFDEIQYTSKVSSEGDWAVITFSDDIRHAGERFRYICEQRLLIEAGLITRIEHRELPGGLEALDAFKRRAGL